MITVREFFKQGRGLKLEIDKLNEARKKAFELACGTSGKSNGEGMQSSETRCTNYAEYSSMIEERIEMLNIYRKDMLDIINKIPNTTYRTLLIARYINCETWESVAESIGYESVKWVRKSLHDKAMAAAEKNKNTTLKYPIHM